jgi:hypothetical protein
MKKKLIILSSLLFVAIVAIAADIKIGWKANPVTDNVIKYNVYRADGTSTTYVLVGTTTNTVFTNSSLTIGQYKWRVTAVNEWGEGPASIPVQSAPALPSAPVDVAF